MYGLEMYVVTSIFSITQHIVGSIPMRDKNLRAPETVVPVLVVVDKVSHLVKCLRHTDTILWCKRRGAIFKLNYNFRLKQHYGFSILADFKRPLSLPRQYGRRQTVYAIFFDVWLF